MQLMRRETSGFSSRGVIDALLLTSGFVSVVLWAYTVLGNAEVILNQYLEYCLFCFLLFVGVISIARVRAAIKDAKL